MPAARETRARYDSRPLAKESGRPATGWIAVSEQMREFYCAGYRWLDAYEPVARIGASIRLYYVPGPPVPPLDPKERERFDWNEPLPCSPKASTPPGLTSNHLSE